MPDSAVIAFYKGTAPDAAGRMIEDLWGWDERRLEMVHDFVQWLFPLPEASRFNPDAPLLSAADITTFRADTKLQERVRRSLDLMLGFLGLARNGAAVVRGVNFRQRSPHWLSPANHNHLRLTRILLFLGHAGLAAEARALLACLEQLAAVEGAGQISPRTLAFWRGAVPRT